MIIQGEAFSFFEKIFKNKLPSNAFLILGDGRETEKTAELLIKFLNCKNKIYCKKCSACLTATPFGLKIYEASALKIEDARDIYSRSRLTSWAGTKIFLIKASSLAFDVQSTLLKTLEEPGSNSYFIFLSPSDGGFSLPLLSRLTTLKIALPKAPDEDFNKYIESKNASKMLETALTYSKDRAKTEKALEAFEFWAEEKIKSLALDLKRMLIFTNDLLMIKKRFYDKTYSNRQLLEHVILSKTYLE
ncbi:hypothetical protein HYW53_04005 [Candidatus Giovannonibacteria bacterium]|nr:hypothetical protein [Candidatus Giovannonibacteria bacterium]